MFSLVEIFDVCSRDLLRIKYPIYKNRFHIKRALDWLMYAQDKTESRGVSGWYSLYSGWSEPYIETTGYIISTFLDCYEYFKEAELKRRAIAMADFLLEMQLPNGGFRCRIHKKTPVVFDTGQDLLGLVDIYNFTKEEKYLNSFIKAANFLCSIQEKDGSWQKFEYGGAARTYETRTAWGLLRSFEVTKDEKYQVHAVKNLDWAMRNQLRNGWFKFNSFPSPNPSEPYTHAISYVLEGFLYSGMLMGDKRYINVVENGSRPILDFFKKNGKIPGVFDKNWQSKVNYTCLTGDAQISLVWLKLYGITKNKDYLNGAVNLNNFLKSTQDTISRNSNCRGAIKGSSPIYGDILKFQGYCRFAYLNWATKFFIDALLEEIKIGNKIFKND